MDTCRQEQDCEGQNPRSVVGASKGPTKPCKLISRERNIAFKRKMAMHALR